MGEEVIDRRAAIEAAFDQHESEAASEQVSNADPAEPHAAAAAEGGATPPVDAPQSGKTEGEGEGDASKSATDADPDKAAAAAEKQDDDQANNAPVSVEKPPASWRPAQKAKWAALDTDVREEIIRRERNVDRILSESSQARKIASAVEQIIQPFQARFQSMNAHPLAAVNELLKADHLLAYGNNNQKAQLIAKLINDYKVDVVELDSVLAGTVKPVDPTTASVQQLLQQQLAPFHQYMENVRQQEALREQEANRQVEETVASMQNNPKFPYFDRVRESMGDIIELGAKKGLYLSLEQAYSRAIALDPEISAEIEASKQAEARKAAALEANRRAQQAKRASKSVGGAPTPAAGGGANVNDRRATISAAFDQVGESR